MVWSLGVVLLAFAANSLLCRWALSAYQFDPWLFSWVRLVSGALMLIALLAWQQPGRWYPRLGQARFWLLGVALGLYALAFSLAYTRLDTGVGAFILFATVQLSLQAFAWWRGTRLRSWQWLGVLMSTAGLALLLLPGARAPQPLAAGFMLLAALGWSGFVLLASRAASALTDVTHAFIAAAILATPLTVVFATDSFHWGWQPWLLALTSGTLASGLGYFLWYRILPQLGLSRAAQVQLLVPTLALLSGMLILQEQLAPLAWLAILVIWLGVILSTLSTTAANKRKTQ